MARKVSFTLAKAQSIANKRKTKFITIGTPKARVQAPNINFPLDIVKKRKKK